MGPASEPAITPKRKTRKPRARQISNWLAFIRPHVAQYNSLPRGEQAKYIKQLSEKTGSSENTLRRFISAARALEAHGIVEFPPTLKRLPAASIELIERIGKKDPELRQSILEKISEDRWTIRGLKATLKGLKEAQSLAPADSNQDKFNAAYIRALIAESTGVDQDSVRVSDFRSSGIYAPIKFSSVAAPVAIAWLPEGKSAVVFFESSLKWATGPANVTKEFQRDIAVATTIYNHVLVVTSSLKSDIERLVSRMREDCASRIRIVDEIERLLDQIPGFLS